ncbi:MAG: hypothetical protein ACYCXW_18215, partial [Solirubrobacteraceae bacterium]
MRGGSDRIRRPTRLGLATAGLACAYAIATAIGAPAGAARAVPPIRAAREAAAACPGWGSPAIAADPRPHALRAFAIQFEQRPATMVAAADYRRAIDCALRTEVLGHLARGRPNLVVFDEDIGLETLAIGPRGARARAMLASGDYPGCGSTPLCPTLSALSALDTGYAPALHYLERRFHGLSGEPGRAFVAATDEFARVFMG